MNTTKKIGDCGEKIAEDFLKKLGYKIIEKNWKYSRLGEIDIIAKDKNELVFVEVKYRRSKTFGSAIEALSKAKFEKVYKSALAYLQQTDIKFKTFRIDFVSIDECSEKQDIQHFKNVLL